MDLTKLSTEDLMALKSGDLAKVSDAGLTYLKSTIKPARRDPGIIGGADPTAGMSGLEKFTAGVGKSMVDLGRGVGQMVGAVSREDVVESRKRDKALMDTGAGMVGNLTGNLAMFAPLAAVPGANTIAGAGALGAVTGLVQPSASTGETLANVGLGGFTGAAVPTAMRAYQASRATAEPFYQAGRERIVGRAIERAAGKDAPQVAQRLAEASRPFVGPSQGAPRTVMGEFVPGSLPTVGQASQNPGVAALERAATATNPDVTNALTEIMRGQNTARVGVLDDMAGSDGMRAFFAADRDAVAEQMYGAARRAGVDPQAITPAAQANIAKFAQRVPDEVIAKAQQLAKINGDEMTDATSVQGLHWMKMAIDDLIGAADRSGNATLKRAYTGLQKDLLTGLDAMSPAYGAARQTYQAMSRPINQMDVAQEIRNKSVNALTGNLQPNSFANALSDKTAQRAIGFTGATLENTLEPAQRNALNSVFLDVQRANAAQNAGRGPGSDTVQKLAYTNLLDQSGVPSFLRDFAPAQVAGNILGRGADAAYGRANRELSQMLAEVMLDPRRSAELMRTATPQQQSAIRALLARGATGAALAIPASANAQQ